MHPRVVRCEGVCWDFEPDPSEVTPARWVVATRQAHAISEVTVIFLGNTTLLFSDGETSLIVDGFLSRPDGLMVLTGKIGPDPVEIARALKDAGAEKFDAVLVGHAHYDHALDRAVVAEQIGAVVMGSESYAFIHRGATGKAQPTNLITLPGYFRPDIKYVDHGRVRGGGCACWI